ncbi:MAG TPA: hypothetical protein VFX98_15030 [Longimicrobiaceae bacterium]|nr:hypothetical protein [Longimicrobiaceae bacterium]
MKRPLGGVLLLLLAACGGQRAEPEPQPQAGEQPVSAVEMLRRAEGFRVAPPPIFGLLGQRDRLSLNSDQVTQLDSLATWLQDANRELNDELRRLLGTGSSGRRRAPRTREEQSRTFEVMQQIGANNRHAVDAVQSVLTDEQERTVCEIDRERTEERGNRPRLPDPYGRRGGIDPDTLFLRPGVWNWCRPAPTA